MACCNKNVSSSSAHKRVRGAGQNLRANPCGKPLFQPLLSNKTVPAKHNSDTLMLDDKYKQFKKEYYNFNDMAPDGGFDFVMFEKTQCDYTYGAIRMAMACHKRVLQRLDEFWDADQTRKADRLRREAEQASSTKPVVDAAALDAADTPAMRRHFEQISVTLPAPSAYTARADRSDGSWLQSRSFYPNQAAPDGENIADVTVFQQKYATEDEKLLASSANEIAYKLPIRPRAFYKADRMDNMDLGVLPMDFIAPELDVDEEVSPQMHIDHDPQWVPDDIKRIFYGRDARDDNQANEKKKKTATSSNGSLDDEITSHANKHDRRRRKKHKPHEIKLTHAEPFQATLRGEEWQRQKQHKLDSMRQRIALEESKYIFSGRFHANPVPAHVKLNLYEQRRVMCAQRRERMRRDRKRLLKRMEYPFSFYEREKLKLCRQLADRARQLEEAGKKQKILASTFKAKRVPSRLFSGDAYEQIQTQLQMRAFEREQRALQLMSQAACPPSMIEHQQTQAEARQLSSKKATEEQYNSCTFKPLVNSKVPNFSRLRRRFNRQLQRAKMVRPPTRLQPFTFSDLPSPVKRELTTAEMYPELTGKPQVNDYDAEKQVAKPPPLVGTTHTNEMRLTRLRNKRWVQECRARELARQEAERNARSQHVQQKLLPIIQAHDEYSNAMRREAVIKMQQQQELTGQLSTRYRKYLKELYSQMDDRPLLIEQQTVRNVGEKEQNELLCTGQVRYLIKDECALLSQDIINNNERDVLEQRLLGGMLGGVQEQQNGLRIGRPRNEYGLVDAIGDDDAHDDFVNMRSIRTQTAGASPMVRKIAQLVDETAEKMNDQPDENSNLARTTAAIQQRINRSRQKPQRRLHTGANRLVRDAKNTTTDPTSSCRAAADRADRLQGAATGRDIERELKQRYVTPMPPIEQTIRHELAVKVAGRREKKTAAVLDNQQPSEEPSVARESAMKNQSTKNQLPPKKTVMQNKQRAQSTEAENRKIKPGEADRESKTTNHRVNRFSAKSTKTPTTQPQNAPVVKSDGNLFFPAASSFQEIDDANKRADVSVAGPPGSTKRDSGRQRVSAPLRPSIEKKIQRKSACTTESATDTKKQNDSRLIKESVVANQNKQKNADRVPPNPPKTSVQTDKPKSNENKKSNKTTVAAEARPTPAVNVQQNKLDIKKPHLVDRASSAKSSTKDVTTSDEKTQHNPTRASTTQWDNYLLADQQPTTQTPTLSQRSRWDDYLPVDTVYSSDQLMRRQATTPNDDQQLNSEVDRLLGELDTAERVHKLVNRFAEEGEFYTDDEVLDDMKRTAELQYNDRYGSSGPDDDAGGITAGAVRLPLISEEDQLEQEIDRILGSATASSGAGFELRDESLHDDEPDSGRQQPLVTGDFSNNNKEGDSTASDGVRNARSGSTDMLDIEIETKSSNGSVHSQPSDF